MRAALGSNHPFSNQAAAGRQQPARCQQFMRRSEHDSEDKPIGPRARSTAGPERGPDVGGLATYRPILVDPQAECEHPARGPLARPPLGAASLNSETALKREVKPLNSKQPYIRVHRQTRKNPYDGGHRRTAEDYRSATAITGIACRRAGDRLFATLYLATSCSDVKLLIR